MSPASTPSPRTRRGSILILVMCAMLIMGFIISYALNAATQDTHAVHRRLRTLQAQYLAEGALNRAKSDLLVQVASTGFVTAGAFKTVPELYSDISARFSIAAKRLPDNIAADKIDWDSPDIISSSFWNFADDSTLDLPGINDWGVGADGPPLGKTRVYTSRAYLDDEQRLETNSVGAYDITLTGWARVGDDNLPGVSIRSRSYRHQLSFPSLFDFIMLGNSISDCSMCHLKIWGDIGQINPQDPFEMHISYDSSRFYRLTLYGSLFLNGPFIRRAQGEGTNTAYQERMLATPGENDNFIYSPNGGQLNADFRNQFPGSPNPFRSIEALATPLPATWPSVRNNLMAWFEPLANRNALADESVLWMSHTTSNVRGGWDNNVPANYDFRPYDPVPTTAASLTPLRYGNTTRTTDYIHGTPIVTGPQKTSGIFSRAIDRAPEAFDDTSYHGSTSYMHNVDRTSNFLIYNKGLHPFDDFDGDSIPNAFDPNFDWHEFNPTHPSRVNDPNDPDEAERGMPKNLLPGTEPADYAVYYLIKGMPLTYDFGWGTVQLLPHDAATGLIRNPITKVFYPDPLTGGHPHWRGGMLWFDPNNPTNAPRNAPPIAPFGNEYFRRAGNGNTWTEWWRLDRTGPPTYMKLMADMSEAVGVLSPLYTMTGTGAARRWFWNGQVAGIATATPNVNPALARTAMENLILNNFANNIVDGNPTAPGVIKGVFPNDTVDSSGNPVYPTDHGARSLIIKGSPRNPVNLKGAVVIRGDVVISGEITGKGQLVVHRNIFIPSNLNYANPPDPEVYRREPVTDPALKESGDFIGLVAGGNVLIGNIMHNGASDTARADLMEFVWGNMVDINSAAFNGATWNWGRDGTGSPHNHQINPVYLLDGAEGGRWVDGKWIEDNRGNLVATVYNTQNMRVGGGLDVNSPYFNPNRKHINFTGNSNPNTTLDNRSFYKNYYISTPGLLPLGANLIAQMPAQYYGRWTGPSWFSHDDLKFFTLNPIRNRTEPNNTPRRFAGLGSENQNNWITNVESLIYADYGVIGGNIVDRSGVGPYYLEFKGAVIGRDIQIVSARQNNPNTEARFTRQIGALYYDGRLRGSVNPLGFPFVEQFLGGEMSMNGLPPLENGSRDAWTPYRITRNYNDAVSFFDEY